MPAAYGDPYVGRRFERMGCADRVYPGIATGVFALKKGFSLGRAYITNKESGAVISVIVLGILILALFTTLLKSSETGPGSMHAPVILALTVDWIRGFCAEVQDVFCRKYP